MILIKRYSNRKLYHTELSQYINLTDVLNLAKGKIQFQVVNHDNKEDITKETLMMALTVNCHTLDYDKIMGLVNS